MSLLQGLITNRTAILDRYLAKQFLGPFLLAVGGFVIIGIVDILFTLVDLFVNSGVPFFTIVRLLLYKIPAIMVLFFPMAVLFSVMLLLVRMAKDNEITVLRSSGVHAGRLLAPIILLCMATSYLSYFTNENIVPWANQVSDNLIRRSIQKKSPPMIVENVFFKDDQNRYFYINSIDKKMNIMREILVYEVTRQFPKFISAKEAFWNRKTWTLKDGYIQEFSKEGTIENITHFSEMNIHVDRDVHSFYNRQKTAREMDSSELKSQINVLNKGGVSTRRLKVEYYMKQSVPVTCLIFGLIGVAFCLQFVRSGKDWWGVIIAVCTVVLMVGFFFFMMAVFRSFGRKGIVTPFIGAWMPNILYGLSSIIVIIYQSFYR